MNDSSNTEQKSSNLKDYRCPHCDKILFKGNVKTLNMVCQHCQKMISVNDNELLETDIE